MTKLLESVLFGLAATAHSWVPYAQTTNGSGLYVDVAHIETNSDRRVYRIKYQAANPVGDQLAGAISKQEMDCTASTIRDLSFQSWKSNGEIIETSTQAEQPRSISEITGGAALKRMVC